MNSYSIEGLNLYFQLGSSRERLKHFVITLQAQAVRSAGEDVTVLLPQAAKEQCLVVGRFIETPDGREIYFHRSSVLNSAFEHFEIGDEVILSEKAGDKGPHATSIRGKRLRKVLRRCSAGQIMVHLRQGTGSAGLFLARLV